VAHALATLLSGAWTILAVVTLRGFVALVVPGAVFRRVGPIMQGGLILGFLAWFVALPQFLEAGRGIFARGGWMRDASPPMWFLGLYETVIGQPQPAFHALARSALLATGLTALAVIVLLLATPARRQADVQASSVKLAGTRSARGGLVEGLARLLLPRPRGRGVLRFTLAALGRSATHRIYLFGAVGAALAWSASGFIWVYGREGLRGFSAPVAPLLVMQQIVVLFVAVAIRFGIGIPLTLPANWLFRATQAAGVREYFLGTRVAALVVSMLPVLLLLPLHALLWTWDIVVYHFGVGCLYAVFVVELLFNTQAKIPFTAPYVSGSIRLKTRWWLYFCGAWMLTAIPTFYEARALRFGQGGAFFPLTLALLAAGLSAIRGRRERAALGLTFDEVPEDAVQTLGLLD
jgi:hypothetical protein